MAYTHFNQALPNPATVNLATVCAQVVANQAALRDMIVTGGLLLWAATPSGGSNFYPAQVLYSKGTERIRKSITWGNSGGSLNNPITVLFEYSSNSGASYDTIGSLNLTYNSDGSWSGLTWS